MASPNVATSGNPAAIFAALGDPTRLELVGRLSDGQPRSIAQLRAGLDLTRQGVTKHLRVLEDAQVVQSKKVGRESRFEYVPEAVAQAETYLQRVSMQWDEAVGRLKRMVEE